MLDLMLLCLSTVFYYCALLFINWLLYWFYATLEWFFFPNLLPPPFCWFWLRIPDHISLFPSPSLAWYLSSSTTPVHFLCTKPHCQFPTIDLLMLWPSTVHLLIAVHAALPGPPWARYIVLQVSSACSSMYMICFKIDLPGCSFLSNMSTSIVLNFVRSSTIAICAFPCFAVLLLLITKPATLLPSTCNITLPVILVSSLVNAGTLNGLRKAACWMTKDKAE